MSRLCRSSVETGLESRPFRPCGQPATEAVRVGSMLCHYCGQHAAAARRFVEQMRSRDIVDIQRRNGRA